MRGPNLKACLAGSTGAAALLFGINPVLAAQTSAGAPAATPVQGPGVSDIVVTAQRRSEKLVDVPISVTALSAEKLASGQITSTTDLDRVTPGLVFPVTGNQVQPAIRGVTSTVTSPGAENTVAIYVDGVYQPNMGSLSFELQNIQQVEVLKGPQGTLFGRNATGGAITIKTYDPGYEPKLNLGASYGGYRDVRLNAYANIPLVNDLLALNLTGYYRHERGYMKNLYDGSRIDGIHAKAFSGKLLLEPSPDFKLILSGLYSDRDNDVAATAAAWNGHQNAYIANPQFTIPGAYETNQNEKSFFTNHLRSTNLRGEWDTGVGTLTSITAYSHYYDVVQVDTDQSPLGAPGLVAVTPPSPPTVGVSIAYGDQKTFSQEFDFASDKFGALSFVSGLYYFHDNSVRTQRISRNIGGTPFLHARGRIETDAYAAFSEVYVDVTDRLHLIGGLRYSSEKRRATALRFLNGATMDVSKSWDAFTPRASVRYELAPRANVYATYSKGFKSGIFNSISLDPRAINPEKIDAYEVGFKFARPGLRFNAAGFYYDWKDIQVTAQLTIGVPFLQNAAAATIKGVDFDFALDLVEGLTLSGGGSFLDAKYDNFRGASVQALQPNGFYANVVEDDSGKRLPRSPKFSGNLALDYRHQFSAGTFGLNGTVTHNSGWFSTPNNNFAHRPYQLVAGEISWTTPDERFRFALWGKNLTNEKKALSVGNATLWDEPRTYGVSLTAKLFD